MADRISRLRAAATVAAAPLALDALSRFAAFPARQAWSFGRHIIGTAAALAQPDGPTGAMDGIADPRRRFDVMRRRDRLTDADLVTAERRTWRAWAFWWAAASLLLAWTILLGARGAAAVPYVGWLAPLAPVVAAGTMAMRAAFAHWQIRRRSLDRFADWLCQPAEWMPPSDVRTGRAFASLAMVLLGTVTVAPSAALAATDPTTASDLAAQMLEALLPGGLMGTGNPLTRAVGTLCAATMWCGVGMLVYHTLVGLATAAHEGKVASQKFHTMWAPLQFCLGLSLIVPLPSGLNGAHGALFLIASGGSKMANEIWGGFVESALTPTGAGNLQATVPGLGIPVPVGGLTVARQVLRAEMCHAIQVQQAQRWNESAYVRRTDVPVPPEASGTPSRSGRQHAWDYGQRCGALTLPIVAATPENGAARAYGTARQDAIGAVVEAVRASGLPARMATAATHVRSPAWPEDGALVAALRPVAEAYEQAMRGAAATFLEARDRQSREKLIQHARSDGWMMAGQFWRPLADAGDQLVQLASETPSVTAPATGGAWFAPGYRPEELRTALARLDEQWARETALDRLSGEDLAAPGDQGSDYLTRVTASITRPLTEGLLNLTTGNMSDPERSLMNLGHTLSLAAGAAIVTGGAVATLATSTPGDIAGMDGLWGWVSHWAYLAIDGAVALGWFLAYGLPMLPYIAVLYLACGWIILVAEAVVAMPLYAMSFIRADGKEFIDGPQRPGAALLFNIFMQPSLGIIGLITAYYLLPMLLALLTTSFAAAYVGQQGGHAIGVFGMLGGIAMLVWLKLQLCSRALELIHVVPRNIPRWLGQSLDGVTDTVQGTSSKILAASHGVPASGGLRQDKSHSGQGNGKDKPDAPGVSKVQQQPPRSPRGGKEG